MAVNRIKEMGYTIKDACKAIGISRSWYYYLVSENKNATKNTIENITKNVTKNVTEKIIKNTTHNKK
jgi:plasmid maintenance system antidote protein VapI